MCNDHNLHRTMVCPIPNGSESADHNIFGYDPHGLVASLCAHFYGPEWRPTSLGHLPFCNTIAAPRYGPPTPQQALLLPTNFKPRTPLYFGPVMPPYLPGPRVWSPDAFAALTRGRRLPIAAPQSCASHVRRIAVEDGGKGHLITIL
jgi:hypothetical protein